MKTLLECLEDVGACSAAYDWVEEGKYETLDEEAWMDCTNAFWKLWLAGRVGALDGAAMSSLLRALQEQHHVVGGYEAAYKALSTQKKKGLIRHNMRPQCPFDHVVYMALGERRKQDFPCALEGFVKEDDEFLMAYVNRTFDPCELARALTNLAEEINPSAPSQEDINEGITLSSGPVMVLHGAREATQEDGVMAWMCGNEIASSVTSEGLFKKLRKLSESLCSPRIFSVNDHGNVTEYDYSGNEIASWV